jgi:hypothetical protein
MNLPDFDDLFKIADEIKLKSTKQSEIKLTIENMEADIFRITTESEDFYVNGKAPSATYVKNTFIPVGINGELIPLRKELDVLDIEIEYLNRKLDLMKLQIEVWRTLQANQRKAIL